MPCNKNCIPNNLYKGCLFIYIKEGGIYVHSLIQKTPTARFSRSLTFKLEFTVQHVDQDMCL